MVLICLGPHFADFHFFQPMHGVIFIRSLC